MRYNLSAIVAIEWPSKQIHLHRASMNISSVKLLSRVKASSRTRRSSSIYCLLSWPDHRSFIECQGPWIMAAIDEERLVALTPFIIKSHTRTQKDSLLWAPFLWTIWHLIFMSNWLLWPWLLQFLEFQSDHSDRLTWEMSTNDGARWSFRLASQNGVWMRKCKKIPSRVNPRPNILLHSQNSRGSFFSQYKWVLTGNIDMPNMSGLKNGVRYAPCRF